MKKISTLALAALAMSAATSVQAQSTGEGLPTGYYKMKSAAADHSYIYVHNDEFNSDNTNHRTLLSQADGTTNNYYWHITNTGNGKVTIVNGQGTAIKYEDGNKANIKLYELSELTLDDSHSTYPTSVYFTNGLHAPGNNDKNHDYGTSKAMAIYTGTAGLNSGTCHWAFTAAENVDQIYTVTITGADNGYVTKSATSEYAYNGGFFFCTTTPQEEDFTVQTIEGCDSKITIDATNKTIQVTYTVNKVGFQSLINNAKAVLNTKRIGYPVETSTAYATFNTAINDAESKVNNNTFTSADYPALKSAILAFKLSNDNVRMPEDGKAYTFTLVTKAGAKKLLNYAESGYNLVEATESNKLTATLVCHQLSNGKYVFVNNNGKYLTYKGSNYNSAVNGNKGYVDSYAPISYTYQKNGNTISVNFQPQDLTLAKLIKGTDVAESDLDDAYITIKGTRGNGNNDANEVYYLIKNGSTFDADQHPYFNDTYSSAFLIEEVTYPNTVSFNAATGIEGVDNIATFSAPFATIKPANVKAYIVKKNDGENATLEEVNGNIPANQGVILTSESTAAVTMIPVAGEGTAEITTNELSNTAGADKTIAADENAYVLTLNSGVVAFYKGQVNTTIKMNKAYLTAAAGSAIALNFGQVTAINNAVVADKATNAPIYDLTGRRVAKMVKGSLYIQSGKKFIAQ